MDEKMGRILFYMFMINYLLNFQIVNSPGFAETGKNIIFHVHSMYSNHQNTDIDWRIEIKNINSEKKEIQFYQSDVRESFCILKKNNAHNSVPFELFQNNKRISRSDDGFLVIPGFPAPCDVLPVHVGEKKYTMTKEAGGKLFAEQYTATGEEISESTAVQNGWIKEKNGDKHTRLVAMTVKDLRGKTVLQQLWPMDGQWWLYEETPYRRSWRK